MAIKIVRISTGEELICDYDDGVLKDVAILIPTEANKLGLAPFMAYSDASDGFAINPEMIMFVVEPVAGLVEQYKNMFSKVFIPESKIII